MSYDPPPEFRDHIARACRYLRHQLHLEEWYGRIRFEDIPGNVDPGDEIKADVKINSVYLHYDLRIGPSMLDDWRNGQFQAIGEDLCHEFCHILTDPLVCWAKADAAPSQMPLIDECNERQTQRIARIIAAALPDGWWKPEYLQRWEAR